MVTLPEAKLFLRVDTDADDALIETMIDAAKQSVSDYLNCYPLPPAAAVKSAVLLRIGDLYDNRSATSHRPLVMNPTFERLLWPYRNVDV